MEQGNKREEQGGEHEVSKNNRPGYPGDAGGKSELGGHIDPFEPIPPSPNADREGGATGGDVERPEEKGSA